MAPSAVTSPGFALRSVSYAKEGAEKLSRRASHHGAIFANPGERSSCLGSRICPEPEKIWQMSEKLIVTIKLSRWRAKIVTSLLPQPSVLWLVMLFNYLVVRILSTIPNCMNNDLIIGNLIVDNVILNN